MSTPRFIAPRSSVFKMTEDLATAGISLALLCMSCDASARNSIKKRPKKWWVRKLFQSGNQHSTNLLDTLRLNDGSGFRNFLRMSPTDFETILMKVGSQIAKKNTNFRESISPANRLAATLRFLASGDSYTSLVYTFRISKQYQNLFQKCAKPSFVI